MPPVVHDVLNSTGQPLDATTRDFMEARFGHDFSRVRVHADARAADSASAVNAIAYTVGHDVVFGRGGYESTSTMGRRLLAHELAHVVQQERAGDLRAGVSDPMGPDERSADAIADVVVKGHAVQDLFRPAGISGLQRQAVGSSAAVPTSIDLICRQSALQGVVAKLQEKDWLSFVGSIASSNTTVTIEGFSYTDWDQEVQAATEGKSAVTGGPPEEVAAASPTVPGLALTRANGALSLLHRTLFKTFNFTDAQLKAFDSRVTLTTTQLTSSKGIRRSGEALCATISVP